MSFPRFLLEQSLGVGQLIELPEALTHRLQQVLRLALGDKIILFNGQGGEYQAQIREKSKRHLKVEIESFDPIIRQRSLSLHLGQVVSKGDRMDYTLQKAVELGVSTITPLIGDYGVVKLEASRWEKKRTHWDQILIHATEQSGRTDRPQLQPLSEVKTWIKDCQSSNKLILSPRGQTRIAELKPANGDFSLLVGAEGGLSPTEENEALAQGFTALCLGPLILRTETAGPMALASLHACFGKD